MSKPAKAPVLSDDIDSRAVIRKAPPSIAPQVIQSAPPAQAQAQSNFKTLYNSEVYSFLNIGMIRIILLKIWCGIGSSIEGVLSSAAGRTPPTCGRAAAGHEVLREPPRSGEHSAASCAADRGQSGRRRDAALGQAREHSSCRQPSVVRCSGCPQCPDCGPGQRATVLSGREIQ